MYRPNRLAITSIHMYISAKITTKTKIATMYDFVVVFALLYAKIYYLSPLNRYIFHYHTNDIFSESILVVKNTKIELCFTAAVAFI